MPEENIPVVDLLGKEVESIAIPSVFRVPVREDIIHRTFVALDTHSRAVQGRDPLAGERTTAETNNPPTGRGISRIPRVKGEHYSRSGAGGGVASTVHGRLPFPTRSEKRIRKRVNKKERRLAIASAIAATGDAEYVARRGHTFTSKLPVVVSDDLEKITKSKDLKSFLSKIGALSELKRAKERSKKTSSRNAKVRRTGAGPLFIVSAQSELAKYMKSIEGISIREPASLSVLDLAPGAVPGRLAIWSKSALAGIPKHLNTIGDRYAS